MDTMTPYAADDIKRKRRREDEEFILEKESIEYKINEFLSLKLEGGKTQIYVKGRMFLQCKRLVLDISKKDIPMYDEINSIDEAAYIYGKHLYKNKIVEGPSARVLQEYRVITPDQEFWGHCSNLQMWYENEYDTRLLHSNLAFVLLKALVDAGDPIAKGVFKTEVAERFGSGYPNTIISIINAKLLDYFSLEEKRELIRPYVPIILKFPRFIRLLDCFSSEEKEEFIQENKAIIFENLKSIANRIPNIFPYLFKERLLDFLELSEKEQITKLDYPIILSFMKNELKSNSLKKMTMNISSSLERNLLAYLNQDEIKQVIHQNFDIILKYLEQLHRRCYTFKILLLGDSSVDVEKNAVVKRYIDDIYDPSDKMTRGTLIDFKTVECQGKRIKLQIWVVGGEERFRFLLPTHCRNADGAFLLYDITQPQTFDNISYWINLVRQKGDPLISINNTHRIKIPIMLVGMNLDLAENQRQVPRDYGLQVAEENELDSFIEGSSKTGQNIYRMYDVMTELILKRIEEATEKEEFKKKELLFSNSVKEVEIQHELKIKDLYSIQYSNFKSKKPKKRVKKRLANNDSTFKIMMLGDADTPKTSLTIRYISGFYLKDLKLTIGVDFYSKTTLYKGKKVKLQIWDFGGEERFRFLLHQYFKGTDAVILLYNITNPSTLEHLQDWIHIVREIAGDVPIILVGAKAHLEELRAVSKEKGILAAIKYNLSGFIEVSAKTGQNVEKVFELIIAMLLEKFTIITGIK